MDKLKANATVYGTRPEVAHKARSYHTAGEWDDTQGRNLHQVPIDIFWAGESEQRLDHVGPAQVRACALLSSTARWDAGRESKAGPQNGRQVALICSC